ncbi:MAG: TolC family protein [Gemmatales bacterium]
MAWMLAATRVLAARAQQAFAIGFRFPQQQTANGSFQQINLSRNMANNLIHPSYGSWATGFAATWELDFWGKFRRSIESATNLLDASFDDYDNVLVSLLGDVATAYTQYRIFEQQLAYSRENIRIQRGSLKIATDRWKAGQTNELSSVQGASLLEQLEATIPLLESGMRQASNQLCVLLGIAPTDLTAKLGKAPIPKSPTEVIAGIPADLLRRRPDLQAAEKQIAALNAQIGVAESALYPSFFISGTIGYQAKDLGMLYNSNSFTGTAGPEFSRNVLNYGRIINNVRLQDYKTQELIGVYQQKVLAVGREMENALVTFVNLQVEAQHLAASVKAAERRERSPTSSSPPGRSTIL